MKLEIKQQVRQYSSVFNTVSMHVFHSCMVYGTVYSYNVTFKKMVSVIQTANYLQRNYFNENFS